MRHLLHPRRRRFGLPRRAWLLALFAAVLVGDAASELPERLAITADSAASAPASQFALADYWFRVWPMRVFGADQQGKIAPGRLQGWSQTDDFVVTHADAADGSWQISIGVPNSQSRTYHTGTSPVVPGSTRSIATTRIYLQAAAGSSATTAFVGYCDTSHWSGSNPLELGCNQYCGVYRNASGALEWVASDGSTGAVHPLDADGAMVRTELFAVLPDGEAHDFTIDVEHVADTTFTCSLDVDGVLRADRDALLDFSTNTVFGLALRSATAGAAMNVMGIGFYQRRY